MILTKQLLLDGLSKGCEKMSEKKKVLVAMSGGVDSSVAVKILIDEGYDVSGATMGLFSKDEIDENCDALRDVSDARKVAEKLGIPFYVFDFKDEFESCVIDNFVDTYQNGKTPNPCVVCNNKLKFGKFLDKALEMGFDYIATGHYVIKELDEKSKRWLLKRSPDSKKDQSYVLYGLTQHQLAHTLFPCGTLSKEDIRSIAENDSLINADKPDSQDICFIPDGDYAAFIENRIGKTFPKGDFILTDGKIMGKHNGHICYTIGQRKGLGVSYTEPLFVVKKDISNNQIVLGTQDKLFSESLVAQDVNFISIDEKDVTKPIKVLAQTRYHQEATPATVTCIGDGRAEVVFDEPKRAISPGQAVVFYDGDYVVGGGCISLA